MRESTVVSMVSNWKERRREGDVKKVARMTGFSVGHISNMINGRRKMNEDTARRLDRISSRRTRNRDLASRYGMTEEQVQYEFSSNN